MKFSWKDKSVVEEVIATESGKALLGLHSFAELAVHRFCQVKSVIIAPKFNHKVKHRDSAVHVRQKLRRIPPAVCDEVKGELEKK